MGRTWSGRALSNDNAPCHVHAARAQPVEELEELWCAHRASLRVELEPREKRLDLCYRKVAVKVAGERLLASRRSCGGIPPYQLVRRLLTSDLVEKLARYASVVLE